MNFILALIPILIILTLMIGFRWGAARSGGAGYLSALTIAVIFFGSGPELLAYAHTKALLLTMDVLMVIWSAFLLYRVVDEAGAINTIGQALPHLTPDRGMQALIIGWVFASFLQGVGGFGVPVAVIAPILVGLGFAPLAAVVIPSIGHGWAVTFGSMGSSFQALLASTGLPAELLAPPTAVFLGISGLVAGLLVAHTVGGFVSIQRLLIPILILGVVMGTVQFLVAASGPWNISAVLAGLAGFVVVIPLAYRYRNQNKTEKSSGLPATSRVVDKRALIIALSGYAVLVVVILIIQLIPAVNAWMGKVVLEIEFPELSTSLGYVTPAGSGRKIPIFRHAGMIILYSVVITFLINYRARLYRSGAIGRVLSGTLQRVMSSSVSIAAMVSMAVIMQHAGMTETLARGIAESTGRLFPAAAPWIGALGAFMTGSNTNSNVVFGALQMRTAELLGYTVPIILAAQTAGAALISVIAPTKLVVGASTVGMAGKEGNLMRKLAPYIGALVTLVSILTIISIWLTS